MSALSAGCCAVTCHGVRFAVGSVDTLTLGEGLESTLSAGMLHPGAPLVAALSAAHMAAFRIPATLRHLIIAADNDSTGLRAAQRVLYRTRAAGHPHPHHPPPAQ